MREFFNIVTTTYHGDDYNLKILNLDLYNSEEWKDLGLNEVYSAENFSYVTDTNNVYQEPPFFGNFVIIQLHTDWTK
jgi:hypothetical protein